MQNPLFQRIDHVGIVVNSITESLQTYCGQLGFTLQERLTLEEQSVEVAFLDAGNSSIELISPTESQSGTARFLAKRGEGPHHICFEVEDIEAALSQLSAQGLHLIDQQPRRGVHGLVAFVHPKATHGTMLELLQKC